MKRLTLDNAFAIAKERGGTCVSTEYINTSTPMRWKCANSHEWTATLNNIKNHKRWCLHCTVNRPLTIENAKQLACSKNGLCISTEYININTPMQWQCMKGHIWTATFHSIKNGKRWCPHCAGNRPLTIENAKQLACSKNGLCISTEYINVNVPMQWHYSEGHEWNASFNNIKNGKKWCPHCAGNRPLTIENAKQLACNRNGTCLSKYFTNSRSTLLWKCAEGHLWTASFSSVKHSNSWCPFCSKYKREKLCREIVSKYLGPPSKIRRPDFLKTPKYYQGLELDIPYYMIMVLPLKSKGSNTKNLISSFIEVIPITLSNSRNEINLRKNYAKKTGLP